MLLSYALSRIPNSNKTEDIHVALDKLVDSLYIAKGPEVNKSISFTLVRISKRRYRKKQSEILCLRSAK